MSSNDFAQDFCHLDRDLDVGAIGGDVFCIQRLLERKKFSNEKPSGTFTEATRRGVAKWARVNKWHHVTGTIDSSLRRAYGETNGFATTSGGGLVDDDENGKNVLGLACVDVCAEAGSDTQFCATKCAPSGDVRDMRFACLAACQDSVAGSCDRMYPEHGESGLKKFQSCLSRTAEECERACARWR